MKKLLLLFLFISVVLLTRKGVSEGDSRGEGFLNLTRNDGMTDVIVCIENALNDRKKALPETQYSKHKYQSQIGPLTNALSYAKYIQNNNLST